MSFTVERSRITPYNQPDINWNGGNRLPEEQPYLDDFPYEWEAEKTSLAIGKEADEVFPEERQSIFESYDAINEAERIQKLSHLSPELQQYYISENLLSYFEEFAAEIRIKKLSGIIKPTGDMEMLGTNVTDMYRHSAELAGSGSREAKEGLGLDMISTGILAGNNRALWVSPPKIADYGFVFTIVADDYDEQLGGRPFRELLLRYDEPIDSIEISQNVYQTLKDKSGYDAVDGTSFNTPDDFLEHPIIYSNNSYEDLNDLYELLQISDQDVEKSEVFRKELRPYIEPMMAEYTNLIRQMSMYDLHTKSEQLEMLEEQCKVLIGGMFNTARIINRRLEKPTIDTDEQKADAMLLQQLEYSSPEMMYEYAYQLVRHEDLSIAGGSSCPVTRALGNSELQFMDGLQSGIGWVDSLQRSSLSELFSSSPKKWKFDKTGTCRGCSGSHESVGLLGPCHVCKKCQKQFDMQEQIDRMVSKLTGASL